MLIFDELQMLFWIMLVQVHQTSVGHQQVVCWMPLHVVEILVLRVDLSLIHEQSHLTKVVKRVRQILLPRDVQKDQPHGVVLVAR